MFVEDICCNMFSEMFKNIIENHISKCTKQLLNISACSIQTMDEILSENLIDIIKGLFNMQKIVLTFTHIYIYIYIYMLIHNKI